MDPVGAGLIDRAHFFPELGEIGGEDRGNNDQRTMHKSSMSGVTISVGDRRSVRLPRTGRPAGAPITSAHLHSPCAGTSGISDSRLA
jgi:hypothetical protein